MKIKNLLMMLMSAVLVISCGDASDSNVEDRLANATITVNPSEIEWSVGDLMGNCFAVGTGFNQDQIIQVDLRDSQNQVIEGVDLDITVDFASNTADGVEVTQLWADVNGNGVIDAGDELASEATDGFLIIQTNEEGVARFLFRQSIGCEYAGSILILTNGGPVGELEFSVGS